MTRMTKITIPAKEATALFKSCLKWLPHFIDQETPKSASEHEAIEKALILATIRACHDVYKRVPGEEEMKRGTSILARKINLFYVHVKNHLDKQAAGVME
jgi:hypothetical protein